MSAKMEDNFGQTQVSQQGFEACIFLCASCRVTSNKAFWVQSHNGWFIGLQLLTGAQRQEMVEYGMVTQRESIGIILTLY